MEQDQSKVKSLVEEFLRAMDFQGEVSLDSTGSDFLRINIQSPEAAFLIGRSGENLKAIQHLCRAVITRQLDQPLQFIIDVNDYQRNRLELIKEMALDAASDVVGQKEPRWLAPMNAYERRLVHMVLAETPGIKTESEGEGDERRIVIRPS